MTWCGEGQRWVLDCGGVLNVGLIEKCEVVVEVGVARDIKVNVEGMCERSRKSLGAGTEEGSEE